MGNLLRAIAALLAVVTITAALATGSLAQSGKPLADLNATTES